MIKQEEMVLNILQGKKFIFLQFGKKYNKKTITKRTNWMNIHETTSFQDNIVRNKNKWRLHYYDELKDNPESKWILEQIIDGNKP